MIRTYQTIFLEKGNHVSKGMWLVIANSKSKHKYHPFIYIIYAYYNTKKILLGWVLKKVQKMFGYKKNMIHVNGKKQNKKDVNI